MRVARPKASTLGEIIEVLRLKVKAIKTNAKLAAKNPDINVPEYKAALYVFYQYVMPMYKHKGKVVSYEDNVGDKINREGKITFTAAKEIIRIYDLNMKDKMKEKALRLKGR
ncbi:MAG: hypothetical protein ABH803_00305 [Candidatus Micrarchaeota archaeon]